MFLLFLLADPKIGCNPHMVVYRALWVDRTKNLRREVAIKALKDTNQDRLNVSEFSFLFIFFYVEIFHWLS